MPQEHSLRYRDGGDPDVARPQLIDTGNPQCIAISQRAPPPVICIIRQLQGPQLQKGALGYLQREMKKKSLLDSSLFSGCL